MMNLIEVHKISETAFPGCLDFDVTADIGSGPQRIDYSYVAEDEAPLNFEIAAWWMSNPDFEIEPYVEPAPSLEDAIAAELGELDDYRWQIEVGGAAFGGGIIRTDWNSQNKIAAAYIMAINDPDYEIPVWEVVPGEFVPLDNATIRAFGVTVRDHVQATFNRKAQLHSIIAALGNVEAVAAFDIEAEWNG